MKLTLEPQTPDEARQSRRAAYQRGAETRIRTAREARHTALTGQENNIEAALYAYREIGERRDVHLRSHGLHLDPPRDLPPRLGGPPLPRSWDNERWREWEQKSRRPIAALAGHRGRAMNFWITMMFDIACQDLLVGSAPINRHATVTSRSGTPSWAKLCGLGAVRGEERARRESMARALKYMDSLGLVKTGSRGRRGAFVEGFSFRDEGGAHTDTPYLTPNPHPPVLPGVVGSALFDEASDLIRLPLAFFVNGWNLVLTSAEIGMYLTVVDAYRRFRLDPLLWSETGVQLTQHRRHTDYGISSESYGTLHNLAEFGLIHVTDPMAARTKGKLTPPEEAKADLYDEDDDQQPQPYQLRPRLEGLEEFAFDIVQNALQAPLPPRMDDLFEDYDPPAPPTATLITPGRPLDAASSTTSPAASAPDAAAEPPAPAASVAASVAAAADTQSPRDANAAPTGATTVSVFDDFPELGPDGEPVF